MMRIMQEVASVGDNMDNDRITISMVRIDDSDWFGMRKGDRLNTRCELMRRVEVSGWLADLKRVSNEKNF